MAIEGGPAAAGDRHVIVLDRSTCTDYELFAAHPHGRFWTAGSGAIFSLGSNHLRPAGWTSADAAGLPILPGLARYAEVAAGAIDHALRFTAPCTGAALRVPGPALRIHLLGAQPAAHGSARAPQGERQYLRVCPTRHGSSRLRSSATG